MDSRILYVPQKENNAIITLNSQIINSLYSKNLWYEFDTHWFEPPGERPPSLSMILLFSWPPDFPNPFDAKLRPTSQELTEKLRDHQSKYTIQFQATRAALIDNSLLKG
ncbi:hypothetical protein YC2023_029792 [Brassica napus]